MAAEGATKHEGSTVKTVTAVALTSGQVIQTPDSRAAVYSGLRAAAAGDYVSLCTAGVRPVLKTASIVFLPGQEVWWKISTNRATYRAAGDFFVGVATAGAAATDTTVDVAMNELPNYVIDSAVKDGNWTTEATLGLGVTESYGGLLTLAFDAVAEAAQAAVFSNRTVDADDGPIYEAEVAIYDIGNNAALDIDFGLVSASHATDLGAVTALVTAHLDGNALDILVQSDDNVTDVAPVDSTIDAVDDTFFFVQVDCRDKANCKVYINGVDAVPTGTTLTLAGYTSTLRAIAHMEKTSDDTVADVRVKRMTVRTTSAA